jgi:gliding motility-associated-like protein
MNCFKPQILNEAPLFICPTQTIRLVSIPNPGVTFDWSNGVASIKNSADPFVLTNIAATYSVKATGEGGNCVVTSAPLIIQSGAGTLPADPAITTNSPICVGTALTLSTPTISGATYSWTGPNNFTSNLSNISISNATIANAGIYSLTVKVGDCSSNAVTKRVDVVSFGSFAITSTSPTNTVCQGQTITLSINSESGYTYQWIKDGTNITGQTSTALAATQEGTYKVKVTNTVLGCSQETAPLTVTVLTAPVASYTVVATACANSNVAFTNTSTIDSRALTIYAWNFGDSETSSDASPTHTYTTAQNFNSQLTVSYSGVPGCTNVATKSITISNAAAPIITSSVTELCATGETTTLSVTGTFSSYLWNTNGTAASLTITTPGTYSVATVDGNGCQSSDDIIIAEKTDCSNTTELKIPLTFTPNGDQTNDKWVIPGIETLVECTMAVFDGRGRRVFEITGYPQSPDGWDGTFEGKEVPKGTYYYVLGCPNAKPVTGSVLVVR